ncbi:MAG: squalene/phytoene synthase family protein [Caldilineaceae bacterium]|nr:squalene/phytoene synthase family protein [Caldilineaceae bacterium]
MQLQRTWERTLLALAYEARHTENADTPAIFDKSLLNRAYRYCDTITAQHSRSFHLASQLLPKPKRLAARALYAFCRVTDDIVDCPGRDRRQQLQAWRRRVTACRPAAHDLVAVAWADARRRYQVPARYAEQLIEGVARDLHQTRYATFDELAAYCYGVASTVGLMTMHIIGYAGQAAIPYAIKLGVALQLTNILRDVREDWRAGRVYLPQEDLAAFGLTEADLAAARVDERWRRFMRFQIERTRSLYEEALPGIVMLSRDGRFAIAAAARLYGAILDDIEAHDYDVFSRRSFIGKWRKLRMLPSIWWRSQTIKCEA